MGLTCLYAPVRLSESIMYSSASLLFTKIVFDISYTCIVAACNFAGALRLRDDFWH